MPSTKLRSNVANLVDALPTSKEAQLAKQGLRTIRDEYLYKQRQAPLNLSDTAALQQLGITEVLLRWLQSPDGAPALDDFKQFGSEALLDAVDEAIKDMEIVRLTLAYNPSIDDLSRFHTWFKAVLGKPVLLDAQYDPSLVAGFTAMAGSKFVDSSIKDKIPQMVEQIKTQFQTTVSQDSAGPVTPTS